jgi:uncharacterized repeat protein (TIGR01451 family)
MPSFLDRSLLVRRLVALLAMLGATMAAAGTAQAQVTFQLRTGNAVTNSQSMTIDSNKCPTQGPTAMYVGGVVTNRGATRIDDVTATLAGLNANVYLAGGQPASQALGSLNANESIAVFWFTGFSCAVGAVVTPSVQVSSSSLSSTTQLSLTIRSAISANAGGQVISSVLGPGAVVGQTVYFDAAYDFGGTAVGDEFFLQPSGGQTFNAACFRLAGTEILATNILGATAGTKDTLYFQQPVIQSGNNYRITVRYAFQYLCANTSTTARPYAVQTSGNINIKYTGNYDGAGSIAIVYPPGTNPFTITKTVNLPEVYVGDSNTLIYTVTVSNPSSQPSVIAKIVDTLPAGVAFGALQAGSAVTAANSSSIPAAGATGTVTFLGKLNQSYVIPAGGSVVLKYSVTRPATTGDFTNSATAFFGLEKTETVSATFRQLNQPPLTAAKTGTVYSDPVNLFTNPKNIPGSVTTYSIAVSNPATQATDLNSVVVSDAVPVNTRMILTDFGSAGSGPVAFVNGSPSSGLAYTYTSLGSTSDDLEFSSAATPTAADWGYVPTLAADGTDPAVRWFRVKLKKAFAAKGQFTVQFRTRLL